MLDTEFSKKIVLSGINPSSSKGLHLGNFLGAGKQHVDLQSKADKAYYFIADYHSLNSVFDPNDVRHNVLNTYLDYLSFGLEPERDNVLFYVESGVPEIAELNLILNNVVSMAELKRMHAYKDKFADGVSEDLINHGLFNYPVLMASDILIFDTDVVPVGEDQAQHVEMARIIARHFNNRYGQILKEPKVFIKEESARVVGTDGEKKMSKSLGNSISIFDSEDEIKKQIFGVKTDPNRVHPTDPGDPTKNPIFKYMRLLDYTEKEILNFEERYKDGSVGDVEIKKAFLDFYLEYFKPMREKRKQYEKDLENINKLITENNIKARDIASNVLSKVRKAIGLD